MEATAATRSLQSHFRCATARSWYERQSNSGDRIGVSDSGSVKLANGEDGVLIDTGATNNTIGGLTATAGNVISGNDKSGVTISGSGTNNNQVLFNVIGLNAQGIGAIANSQGGVTIRSGAANNQIGTATTGNTISETRSLEFACKV